MANIIFMRHAKTTLNQEGKFAGHEDCDTTQQGLEEAKKDFKYDPNSFPVTYCSPLKRTQQTLEAVVPGSHPIIDPRIMERFLGDWESRSYDSIDETIKELYAKGKFDPSNSEPVAQVKKRTCEFIEEIYEQYIDEKINILVVSHAGILRQVRDEFFPNMEGGIIKNATTFEITEKEFEAYMKRKEEEKKKISIVR